MASSINHPNPENPANQGSDVPPHPNPLPRGGEGTLVSPPPIIPIPKIPRIKVQTFPLTLTLSRAVERGLSCLLHQSSQSRKSRESRFRRSPSP